METQSPISVFSATLALLAILLAAASATAQDDVRLQEEIAMKAAVAAVAPSVVRIETLGGLERVGRVLVGTGPTTGLVVSEDGYVISSAFNFIQQPTSILVTSPSGKRAAAEIVGRDRARMLVLLKVNTDEKLPVPPMVPRSEMVVGQWTIAVGRTFEGPDPNLSVGVLSARDRIWGKAIQTDAKISPNNYGGPLVDIRGRVLGVLVPLSPQGQDEVAGAEWYDSGIGFAVPLVDILPHLDKLKRGEELKPGVLGLNLKGTDIYSLPAEVAAVQPKSPAYAAGLKAGDVIVQADGEEIVRQAQLRHVIGRHYAGDQLSLVAKRGDQQLEMSLQLADKLEPYEHPFLGLLPLRGTDPEQGVTVRYVYPGSPAAEAGIQAGDRLLTLAGTPLPDLSAALQVLANYEPKAEIAVQIQRDGQPQDLKVKLAALPKEIPADLPPAHAPADPAGVERPAVGAVEIKLPEESNDCVAYVPETYHPGVPHGVIVWLTEPGKFDREKWIEQFKPLCDRNDLIAIAPQPADAARWQPTEVEFIRKSLDDLISKYNIDRTRIVAQGSQAGGAMAWLTALNHRDLIRAVAPFDTALPARAQVAANDPIERLAIYVAFPKNSKLADRIRAEVKQLETMKYPVLVQELEDDAKQLTETQTNELTRWIDTLDRL
jgi:serine protease Do